MNLTDQIHGTFGMGLLAILRAQPSRLLLEKPARP